MARFYRVCFMTKFQGRFGRIMPGILPTLYIRVLMHEKHTRMLQFVCQYKRDAYEQFFGRIVIRNAAIQYVCV